MITDSAFWKKPLLKGARLIDEYMGRDALTERQFARIERELFIGFYSVRKLLEATAKVSDSTRSLTLEITWYPKRSEAKVVDWYNRSEFWELYDLDDPRSERRDILYVAHRMIHSFIFMLSDNECGHGVFFTSDNDKEKRLCFLQTSEIVRAFETVGNDYPTSMRMWRDPETGEMRWAVPTAE